MTGQDAVRSAKAFNDALELDGVIMTKLDGDARGGAALSVKAVTGVPIKFIGTGEHLDALDEFDPERVAGRILGMGDIVGLVKTTQEKLDKEEMQKAEEKLRKGEFTLDDFKKQLGQISKLGPIQKVIGMIPGMGGISKMLGDQNPDMDMKRLVGIIDSMTLDERRNPRKTVDQSRRTRIAKGAGVQPNEVNDLVKQFDAMADMMKKFANMGMMERMKAMSQLGPSMMNPNAKFSKPSAGTGKRLTSSEKAKLKKQREKELRRRKRKGKDGDDGAPASK
jgi:signal recognition particle subunit SRP54